MPSDNDVFVDLAPEELEVVQLSRATSEFEEHLQAAYKDFDELAREYGRARRVKPAEARSRQKEIYLNSGFNKCILNRFGTHNG